MHIKKDDTVIVLTGKDKGKKGKVLKVMPKKNMAIVEGINIQTKHRKLPSHAGVCQPPRHLCTSSPAVIHSPARSPPLCAKR